MMLVSLDKAAFLAADAAILHDAGLPRLEGHWAGGGIHVPGVGPDGQGLWTLRDEDILQATDGTYGRTAPESMKVAPIGCTLATWDERKMREAVRVSAEVAKPAEEVDGP